MTSSSCLDLLNNLARNKLDLDSDEVGLNRPSVQHTDLPWPKISRQMPSCTNTDLNSFKSPQNEYVGDQLEGGTSSESCEFYDCYEMPPSTEDMRANGENQG
jgi:hypothetical protein